MKSYLSLVKFSHTIFALPFALMGYVLALQDSESTPQVFKLLGLVLVCMVSLRSAAMAFNRYVDRDIDKLNDRTKNREIPAGIISTNKALAFVIGNILIFLLACYLINPICFYLAPVAIIITLGYSYTKRFTYLCHFVLGLGLALAPVGAYIAVTSKFALIPILYGAIVMFWVAGFDIIYALQDEEFDRVNNLNSIPQKLGKAKALLLARALHFGVVALLIVAAYFCYTNYPGDLKYIFAIGNLAFICLLIFQHTLISEHDLSRINLAFFTTNGMASVMLGISCIIDFYL